MIRRVTAICGVTMLLFCLGCGNKGPLYLPQGDVAEAQDPAAQQEKQED